MENKKIRGRATRTSSICTATKRILGSLLCAVLIVGQTSPVFATDEYGDPIVTATPVPAEVYHTEYYNRPADTDSIEGWVQASDRGRICCIDGYDNGNCPLLKKRR